MNMKYNVGYNQVQDFYPFAKKTTTTTSSKNKNKNNNEILCQMKIAIVSSFAHGLNGQIIMLTKLVEEMKKKKI